MAQESQNACFTDDVLEFIKKFEPTATTFFIIPQLILFNPAIKGAKQRVVVCIGANKLREVHISEIVKRTGIKHSQIYRVIEGYTDKVTGKRMKGLVEMGLLERKVNEKDKKHAERHRAYGEPDKKKEVSYIAPWVDVSGLQDVMRTIEWSYYR